MKTTIPKDVYEAMVKRISVVDIKTLSDEEREMMWVRPYQTLYRFDSTGLNDSVPEDEYVDSLVHPMRTKNMWNVCNRFYMFLKNFKDIDKRLLKSHGKH